ncbi:MAG: hypothetical protein AB7O48_18930 [Cyclobacteriaceae bacterium]
MKINLKWLGLGFLTWLIPFIVSFGFYDRSGSLATSEDLFKSVMIVVSSVVGGWVLFSLFKGVKDSFVKWSWIIGAFLLSLNWVLDLVILVPFAKMDGWFYFESIGIRYLQILAFSVTIGFTIRYFQKS